MAKKKDDDVDPVFVNEEEAEIEFTDDEPAEDPDKDLPEEIKKESKASLYEKVKAAEKKAAETVDPTERIVGAFSQVAEKLQAPQRELAAAPVGESEADFQTRLKKDLFDEDKAEGVLNELIDRRLGPRLAQSAELNFKQAEALLLLDPDKGPTYKKYRAEVTQRLSSMPANVRNSPLALEYAFEKTQVAHIQDIAQDRANTILETERKKAPEKREPLPQEAGGGGGSSSAASPQRRKIIVQITQADRENADILGVDASVIAERRARGVS